MGKERGKDESGTSGCQALTTERGLRSGAALVLGPLWAACVVWSPSLGREDTGEEGFASALPKSVRGLDVG